MPLPFLKNKQVREQGVAAPIYRKPDEGKEPEHEGMHAVAEDILRAVEQRDSKALAAALHSAFEIAELQPHEEGPHIEEEND